MSLLLVKRRMNINDSANKNSTRLNAEPIQLNLEKKNDIIQKKINKVRSPKAAISPDVQEAIDKVHELQRSN